MKLEFIKNINGFDEHAIRLSDFTSSQAAAFRDTIDGLIADSESPLELDLTSLDFMDSVNCRLLLRTSAEDTGISTTDNINFICDLTLEAYKGISKLLQPFCRKESRGYQWLYDIDTPIGFLFSSGRDIPKEE